MKVAFATSNRVSVDQHFGASSGFAIYGIDETRTRLIELVEFPDNAVPASGADKPAEPGGGSHSRLAEKIAALDGCAAVYCLAVGGAAVRQLLARGIQPMRLDDAAPIDALLDELRRLAHVGGVAWIDRAVRRASGQGGAGAANGFERLARLADEAWEE
jgi:nitrogen fixation protein NifX